MKHKPVKNPLGIHRWKLRYSHKLGLGFQLMAADGQIRSQVFLSTELFLGSMISGRCVWGI
jgi:hypothetical protein